MNIQIFIFFILLAVVLSAGVFIYYIRKAQKADRVVKETKKNGRNWRYYSYIFLSRNQLTKRTFRKIRNRLQNIYPADDMAINLKATNILTVAYLGALVIFIFVMIAARGDVFYIMAGCTLIYTLFTSFTNGRLERLELKIMVQFQNFIDMVREEYNDCKRVDDSVGRLLDRLPYEIALHAEIIHNVLTSTKVEEAADRYIEISPNRFFMMFTAISATTMEYGDKLDEHKSSVFLKNLNFLKEEVNIELLKMRKIKTVFGGLSAVALGAILAVKPIEYWAEGNIPEMASYYKGSYGIIMMVAVFLASITAYTLVNNLKDAKKDEVKEDSRLRRLAMKEPIHSIIVAQVNRNYSKALRHDEMLRFTGDHLGINTFILKRYVFAIATIVATFALFTTSVIRDRYQQISDFNDAFATSMAPDEEYIETMEEVGEAYAHDMRKMTGEQVSSAQSQEELKQRIMNETEVKDEAMAELVAKEIAEHVVSYHNSIFQWYFLLIIILSGVIGYYVPLWNLILKQKAVLMNMEDEVAQFQTITLILMHVDGMNIKKLLEWLERFSYCFKASIQECSIDIAHNEEKALHKLREAETFNLFQSYVGNLISIDKVGIEKAFSSLETDREYYKKKREDDNNAMIQRKSTYAKWISVVPLVLVFGGYLIYPMMQMAMNMMSEINNAL